MNIYEKLNLIQVSLKSPKSQYNSFGKYAYRSCGDILESVKAQLAELKVVIVLSDELVQIGDRYYIKATATLHDLDGASISNTAYAREEENKKGMDGSQVTGASSSYARKYALNGLLAIDDTKDSDATNKGEEPEVKPDPVQDASEKLKNTIIGPVSVSRREVEQGKATSVDKNTRQEVKAQKVDIIGILEIVNKKSIENQDKFWGWLTDVYHTTKLEDLSFNQATELRAKLMKKEAKKTEIKERI